MAHEAAIEEKEIETPLSPTARIIQAATDAVLDELVDKFNNGDFTIQTQSDAVELNETYNAGTLLNSYLHFKVEREYKNRRANKKWAAIPNDPNHNTSQLYLLKQVLWKTPRYSGNNLPDLEHNVPLTNTRRNSVPL